ncbi:uncharacterized protein TNCV_2880921 [Trichonephila clavipes]|nr:uncharacterized protein TNCV_2880921 [Trichonephila clavipes]
MPRQKRTSLVSKQKANKRWCSEHYSHETGVFRKDKTSISSALPERNMRCQTLEDSCLNDLNCCENSEAPHYVIMDVQFLKGLLKNLLCDVCKSYSLKIDICEKLGFSRKISVFCISCDIIKSSNFTSRRIYDSEGVGCVIGLFTGFVMDFEIMSKRCIECEHAKSGLGENSAEFHLWYEGHISSCAINPIGSSCAMEPEAAALKLWQRSEDNGFQYTTLLSDGDAKTYQYLNTKEVYSPEIKIKKEECINHAALARGEVPGPHVNHVKTPLKEAHLAKIMPIYQRLASIELFQRYIRCVTQNANESLHSIIWGKCSKETSATLRRVTIAVCDAVCEFNFGAKKLLENLQKENGLASNKQSRMLAAWRDYLEFIRGKEKDWQCTQLLEKKLR